MRWRHLLLIPIVPLWLIYLWYSLMLLASTWESTPWKLGWSGWPRGSGSVLIFSSFLLTNVAAFKESPGARFGIAFSAGVLGWALMWKSLEKQTAGDLLYGACFVSFMLVVLYYSIRWIFDRDNSFAE